MIAGGCVGLRVALSWGLVVSAVFVAGCSSDGESAEHDSPARSTTITTRSTTTIAPPTLAPVTPLAYLTAVEDTVRAHAYYVDRVDWAGWEAEVTEVVAEADDPADTYDLVHGLVAQLDDRHSQFWPPGQAGAARSGPDELPAASTPSGEVTGSLGRIELPAVSSGVGSGPGADYISIVRDTLRRDACGWIVDLRSNGGGDVTTMLAAVAPLLGPGPSVAYRERDGTTHTFAITRDGDMRAPDGSIHAVDAGDAGFVPRPEPVAVLYGPETASSGEGVAMAFRGRPDTRSFGRATAGVPTGREIFDLPGGSALALTTSIGVDTAGVEHEDRIPPDVESTSADLLDTARYWLADHAACG